MFKQKTLQYIAEIVYLVIYRCNDWDEHLEDQEEEHDHDEQEHDHDEEEHDHDEEDDDHREEEEEVNDEWNACSYKVHELAEKSLWKVTQDELL